jgi:hypothetical protein
MFLHHCRRYRTAPLEMLQSSMAQKIVRCLLKAAKSQRVSPLAEVLSRISSVKKGLRRFQRRFPSWFQICWEYFHSWSWAPSQISTLPASAPP